MKRIAKKNMYRMRTHPTQSLGVHGEINNVRNYSSNGRSSPGTLGSSMPWLGRVHRTNKRTM